MTITDTPPSVFKIGAEDVPPDFNLGSGSTDSAPTAICAYDGCTNVVVKPARGRTPRFCPEHRPEVKTNAGRTRASWAKAADVEQSLNTMFGLAGALVHNVINEADGTVIQMGTPALVKALVDLGRVDKGVRKYLEIIATPGKYGPLTFAVAGIVIPILANHGLLPTFVLNLGTTATSNGEGES